MHTKYTIIVTLAVAMSACFACKGKDTPAENASDTSIQAVSSIITPQTASPAASAAKSAYIKKDTYFKLPAVAGGDIDLASYAGKPIMFMLFTETCPYCRRAAPSLEKIHKTYGPKGLAVLGLCTQDSAQAAKNFAADLGTTFPLAYDGRPVYQQYRAQGVPYIFLLNAQHEVVAVWPGYDRSFDPQMVKAVEAELAKK
ncbi:MAG: hypothetical protein A2285_10720 [Elusimicrobia bacterium RIFOXYA12_FULL_57_11]|nr:MAG: hypothetical protein A2285_10720 [Elusimicrobia bacterium RIFOXYA12_FULL_57_11]